MAFSVLSREDRGPTLGDILANAISSGFDGYETAKKRQREDAKNQIDTQIKLIELQQKMQEMEQKKKQADMTDNFLKAFGVAPLDQTEKDTARASTFAGINEEKQRPKINTSSGRLGEIFKKINPSDYDMEAEFDSNSGVKFTVKKKKTREKKPLTEDQGIDLRSKIRAQAERMAFSESAEKLKVGRPPTLPLSEAEIKSNVTEEMVGKYLKPSELFLTGKTSEYDAMMKDLRKKSKEEADPFGLLQ